MDYKQRQKENEETIKKLCPRASHTSGIYCFYRYSEQGIRHAYVGLARTSLLKRLAQHLDGYNSHIDLSIKKHGLYDFNNNPNGYKIDIVCFCKANECEEKEQYWIKQFADKGWQLKNVEGGGLKGKTDINERKPPKTYRDGLKQGYVNAQRDIAKLFEKNLTYGINGEPNKNKEKALAKFEEFIKKEE